MAAPNTSRFSPADLAVMKEYEIITLKYNGTTCMLWCIQGYNSLGEPTMKQEVGRKTCVGKGELVDL